MIGFSGMVCITRIIIQLRKAFYSVIVSVYLHTILQRHTPLGIVRQLDVTLPPGSNLLDLLRALNVEFHPEQIMLVVNGVMTDELTLLSDGDRVNLMPAISGG